MSTIDQTFRSFESLMDLRRLYLEPWVTFPALCRLLGVNRRRFDSFLYDELGYHGEEILSLYRTSRCKL